MSCNSSDRKNGRPDTLAYVDEAEPEVLACAIQLFGADASTAVALCGLDAWLDGNQPEFQRWCLLFGKLRN